MREIEESDWKILRRLHPLALERLCKQVLLEIERIHSDSTKSSHERYLLIFQVMRSRDKEIALTFDDLRRSTAFPHIAAMKSRGLLTPDEFSKFSQDTQDVIDLLLN